MHLGENRDNLSLSISENVDISKPLQNFLLLFHAFLFFSPSSLSHQRGSDPTSKPPSSHTPPNTHQPQMWDRTLKTEFSLLSDLTVQSQSLAWQLHSQLSAWGR